MALAKKKKKKVKEKRNNGHGRTNLCILRDTIVILPKNYPAHSTPPPMLKTYKLESNSILWIVHKEDRA